MGQSVTKRPILGCMVVAVVFASSAALVWADDIYPPPWQRGGPRTTYQGWTFSTDANPTAPDEQVLNPYGVPLATIVGGAWSQFEDNHVGVWSLLTTDSFIDVPIPNAPDHPDWNKSVWTQLTWAPEPLGTSGAPSIFVDGIESQLVETIPLHDSWLQSTWLTTLPYNPELETLHITGLVDVGEIVVDTRCIPEPSTLVLLTMSVFGIAAFVWRRRS